jgi:hypothetical protein
MARFARNQISTGICTSISTTSELRLQQRTASAPIRFGHDTTAPSIFSFLGHLLVNQIVFTTRTRMPLSWRRLPAPTR